jgi:trimeric autotransporter adhesin
MSMLLRWSITVGLLALYCTNAQVITTIAGTDFTYPSGPLPAMNAPLGNVQGVAVDALGNVFLSDQSNNLVLRRSLDGTLTAIAGNGIAGFSGDGGPATSASLNGPFGIALDSSGNLYIADNQNGRVRKVSGGIITTVAGNGVIGFSGDGGPATAASLSGPSAVALDAAGDLYIADFSSNRVREVSNGIITTVAGNGGEVFSCDDGVATSANLHGPRDIALDSAGNLYIADEGNNCIREVTAGIITTVVNSLYAPQGVIVDSKGDLYISDSFDQRILRVLKEAPTVVAGGNGEGFAGDGGLATSAQLAFPSAIALDSNGNLYIADSANYRVRVVNAQGVINTIAGNGNYQFAGDGDEATSAALNQPASVALDNNGNLYVADTLNRRVRKIAGGIITTIAGTGTSVPFSSNESSPTGSYPLGLAVDAVGNLYISLSYCCIQVIPSSGKPYTIQVSNYPQGVAVDGNPQGLAIDSSGNLYFANGYVVGLVTPDGAIKTIAGTGSLGSSGDGGPATEAAIDPVAVAVDRAGDIYIVDQNPPNSRIRKVSNGIITTFAGGGQASGDGVPATSAALFLPTGVAVDVSGNVYIADAGMGVIRKVSGGIISTIVGGSGGFGYSGDGGLAINAQLDFGFESLPQFAQGYFAFGTLTGMLIDSSGNLLIPDSGNNRIRKVLATTSPSVSVVPQQLQFTAASNGAPTQPQALSLTSPVDGLAFSENVPSDATWLQVNPASGASPRLIQVVANPAGLAPMTYQTTLTVNVPNGSPSSIIVPVTFNVTSALSPVLAVDKASLSFPFPVHGSARSQTITVSNTGGSVLPFATTATANANGDWLSVSPPSAPALPGSPATVTVSANPAGLSPGAYVGEVTVMAGAQSKIIPVTMTISKLNQAILLSQSGLSFLAVQGGGVVPPQSFGVQNIGTGVIDWTASASTLAGGGWLQVTPSGSSDATAPTSPRATVTVNGSALPAGTYYGLLRVDAPGAANTPQVLTVVLLVLPANTPVPPVVQPSQLVFTAPAGGESPSSQTVQVYNIVPEPKSFQSQVSPPIPGLSVTTLPQASTLDPQQPTSIVVQPFTSGLSAGVYNEALTLQFSDGSVSAVNASVIVTNAAATNTSAIQGEARPGRPANAGASCPTKLILTLTTLGQGFTVPAGSPTALIVNVVDNCGNPMPATGSVTVNFSNGDSQLSLLPQGGGNWEYTWLTGNASLTGVTLTIRAASPQGLTGNETVTVNLASQQQQPVIDPSKIFSAFAAVPFTALAPGSVISIYGNYLAQNTAQAQTPLPPQLVDTQVFVTGMPTGLIPLPLYYVSQTQVNAIVPYEVAVDTSLDLIVQRGTTLSSTVPILVAQAQPAMLSGGVYDAVPSDGGQPYFVSPTAPAHAGDTIELYCTGLGAVNPSVVDGAEPLQLTYTAGTPQLMIGGQSAQLKFSGLAPMFAGLYQVNAVVPSGTKTGATVPVTLSIDGQTSPVVTIAIQ